ncbi:MAG: nucleotidyltransferase family protein [Flavitalea sp.]
MNNNIAIVVLAAGASQRMGERKQLLNTGDKTFLEHSLHTAKSITPCTVAVLGAYSEEISANTNLGEIQTVINHDWQTGMGSSIKKGLEYCLLHFKHPDAILFTTCDMPDINGEYLRRMIGIYSEGLYRILATAHGSSAGIPTLFDNSLFAALSLIDNERGAKNIISRNRKNTLVLDPGKAAADIDTPAQYEAWLRDQLKQ